MKKIIFALSILFFFSQCHVDKDLVTPQTSPKGYVENIEMIHYVVLNLSNVDEMSERKATIKKYHDENGFSNLRISMLKLTEENPVLVVRRFANFEIAKQYIDKVGQNFSMNKNEKLYAFSQENYRNFLREKDIKAYDDFYKKINSGD